MATLHTYTILQRGRITTTVRGAKSHTYADQAEYDGSNYRNTLDASYLGRQWAGLMASAGPGPPPVSATTYPPESFDDQLQAVAPHNELKKRTKLIIWDDVNGTGNILFEGWADRIESFSIGTYQTL